MFPVLVDVRPAPSVSRVRWFILCFHVLTHGHCPPLHLPLRFRFDAKEKGIQKLTDKLEKVCDEMKQLNSDGAQHIAASTDK